MQQIPRSNIEVKPMFRAPVAKEYSKEFENKLELNLYDEVETQRGWVKAKDLILSDVLIEENNVLSPIKYLSKENYKIQLEV